MWTDQGTLEFQLKKPEHFGSFLSIFIKIYSFMTQKWPNLHTNLFILWKVMQIVIRSRFGLTTQFWHTIMSCLQTCNTVLLATNGSTLVLSSETYYTHFLLSSIGHMEVVNTLLLDPRSCVGFQEESSPLAHRGVYWPDVNSSPPQAPLQTETQSWCQIPSHCTQ